MYAFLVTHCFSLPLVAGTEVRLSEEFIDRYVQLEGDVPQRLPDAGRVLLRGRVLTAGYGVYGAIAYQVSLIACVLPAPC